MGTRKEKQATRKDTLPQSASMSPALQAAAMKSSHPVTIHFKRFSVLTVARVIENMRHGTERGTNSE
jgi:hypothetical protein